MEYVVDVDVIFWDSDNGRRVISGVFGKLVMGLFVVYLGGCVILKK